MNFGTVGTSWITHSFIEASFRADDFKLSAIYSRTEAKAQTLAEKYNMDNVYTDIKQMAMCDKVDCVYIASPNSLHYEQAITFLKHKKHVICEKPIFSNVKQLKHAYQIAKDNDVFLFEAMRNLHSPNFNLLKDALKNIGKVRSANIHRIRYSSRYDEYLNGELPNVFSLEYAGGALMDLGIYPLNIALALFGRPEKVSYTPVILASGVDGSGTLVLDYGDYSSTVMCSKITTSYIPCEIHGEKGSILFDNAGKIINIKHINHQTKQETHIESPDYEHDMVYEINNIKRMIESKNVLEYDQYMEQSLLSLSIIEEALDF